MSYSFIMTKCESFHELLEIESSSWLLESSRYSDEIEKFTTSSQFKDNVIDLSAFARSFVVRVMTDFNLIDDVRMFKTLQSLNFCHD